jgi:hypothetical protein
MRVLDVSRAVAPERGHEVLARELRHEIRERAERPPLKRPTLTSIGFRKGWRSCPVKGCSSALFGGGGFPIAQRETTNDKMVNISFWISVFVPDALYWRILPSRQAVDRIIFARNVDDHSTGALAAQFAFRCIERRLAKDKKGNSGDCYADDEQRNGLYDQFHDVHSRLKPRGKSLSNLLTGERSGFAGRDAHA